LLLLPATAGAVEIETLSNRADLVSGGDALVRVTGAEQVELNGRTIPTRRPRPSR
jgi:hypothetical protein